MTADETHEEGKKLCGSVLNGDFVKWIELNGKALGLSIMEIPMIAVAFSEGFMAANGWMMINAKWTKLEQQN